MKLLVGLGNPGNKYETTRHNAGFLMLDELASHFKIDWSGEKFKAVVGKGKILNQECILLKPITFMNLSGFAVAAALRFFKIDGKDLIVLHDDIDVPSCKVKTRFGGGHGGHNGIRSIHKETGFSDFHRIKLGVGKPIEFDEKSGDSWVLGPLKNEELIAIQEEMFKDVLIRLGNIFSQHND